MLARPTRLAATLSDTSAISLVVLTVATAAVFFSDDLKGRLGLVPQTVSPTPYRPGDAFDIRSETLVSTRQVFVFARSRCGACDRAWSSLRRVVRAAESRHVPAILVVPSSVTQGEREFAASIAIPPQHIILKDPAAVRVRAVPAVVVIDAAGRVVLTRGPPFGEVEADQVIGALAASGNGHQD